MFLSQILQKIDYSGYVIENETEIDCLCLSQMKPGGNALTFLDNVRYLDDALQIASMVMTTKDIAAAVKEKKESAGICICQNPRILFFRIHNFLANTKDYTRTEFKTVIGDNCRISPLAYISDKNVIIGKNVTIEEFVSVKENTVIGNHAILRAGAVIGGEGFEFKREGIRAFAVRHTGGVVIGSHVEIQYHTTVDRAIYPWDDTIIEDYAKIDNLVYIAHGVKIGKGVMVAANSTIGGRTIIKESAWVGLGATIRNGLEIGHGARVNMGAVVTRNVPEECSVTGNFAIPHDQFIERLKNNV